MITEEELNGLNVDDLFSLLTENLSELFVMEHSKKDRLAIHTKQKEVELIQRVLIIRRSGFPPG